MRGLVVCAYPLTRDSILSAIAIVVPRPVTPQHGFKTSIERTHKLVSHISALSQRLSETAIENIEPKSGSLTTTAGLRKLIELANADIDRICTQAAEFASDDHVDVVVRQQLATLIFDNAEMRKQLNAYTEGILVQTLERLDVRGATGNKAKGSTRNDVQVQDMHL